MRKYFGAAAVAVFMMAIILALWGSNRDMLESPVASIPQILIDYNDDQTDIYVHGMYDYKYTNITMQIFVGDETFERSRENVYSLNYNTSADEFGVNITVWNKKKAYSFNATIKKASPDEAPKLLTLIEHRDNRIYSYTLDNTNLPWKRLMERMQ